MKELEDLVESGKIRELEDLVESGKISWNHYMLTEGEKMPSDITFLSK